jgi:hypothetical protein
VVFDESLSELFSIGDPGFQGYALAARTLRDDGYRVSSNLAPLAALLPTIARPGEHVLVIALPTRDPAPGDVHAVRAFVARGGGLLVLAEHDDIYGNATRLNGLLARVAIAVVAGQAASARRPDLAPGPVTVAGSPAFGLESVVLYLAAPVRSESGSTVTVLAGDAAQSVALGVTVGRGRIALVGDAEWLWNGTPTLGLRAGDNLAFLRHVIAWLTSPPDRAAAALPEARTAARIVALADQHGYPFGTGATEYGALLKRLEDAGLEVAITHVLERAVAAEVVIVGDPTRPLPGTASRARLVALLHATSGPPPPWSSGGASADHPASAALAEAGITLETAILAGVPAEPDDCSWHRAAALRVSAPDAVVRVTAPVTASASVDLMPLVTPARTARRSLASPPAGSWPLVVESPRVLVFASGTVLTNGSAGTTCYDRMAGLLVTWLADGERGRR